MSMVTASAGSGSGEIICGCLYDSTMRDKRGGPCTSDSMKRVGTSSRIRLDLTNLPATLRCGVKQSRLSRSGQFQPWSMLL